MKSNQYRENLVTWYKMTFAVNGILILSDDVFSLGHFVRRKDTYV